MTIVQVAFQGGGAKFVNLLAVAEALEEAHNARRITITRVAGTSAGSIVACLLASGIGIPRVRDSLDTKDMKAVAKSLSGQISILSLIRAVAFGTPIKSMAPLSDWLKKLLNDDSGTAIDRTIAQVCDMRKERKMKLMVVSSDLIKRGSHLASDGDSAIKAIEDSCGIPFAFRTWKGAGYTKVDGGLCSNLPVDYLLDNVSADGEILAVSFSKPVSDDNNGCLNYMMALIDTAISSGEEKSRQALPKANVLSISTKLKTMDFYLAISEGLGDQYGRIKMQADLWINNYLDIQNKKILNLIHDPWGESSPTTSDIMLRVGDYYEKMEKKREISYDKAIITIVARSLESDPNMAIGANDVMRLELTFSCCEDPIHMISMSVTEIDEQSSLDASSLECRVTGPDGKPVAATLIPMRLRSAPSDRNVAVCFTPPLPAKSGPYHLDYSTRGKRLLRKLQVSGEDSVCYFPSRASKPVSKVALVVQIPDRKAVCMTYGGKASNMRAMQDEELPSTNLSGLDAIGCVADDVEKSFDQDLWHMRLVLRQQNGKVL